MTIGEIKMHVRNGKTVHWRYDRNTITLKDGAYFITRDGGPIGFLNRDGKLPDHTEMGESYYLGKEVAP